MQQIFLLRSTKISLLLFECFFNLSCEFLHLSLSFYSTEIVPQNYIVLQIKTGQILLQIILTEIKIHIFEQVKNMQFLSFKFGILVISFRDHEWFLERTQSVFYSIAVQLDLS